MQGLEANFFNFLISEKGYHASSLYLEAPLNVLEEGKSVRRYIADLIILDTAFNEYLALVEFKSKSSNDVLLSAHRQVTTYLNVLNKPNLPAYLVVPTEDEFAVYVLSGDFWTLLNKSDFPQYEALKSKVRADDKNVAEELNKEYRTQNKYKKNLFRKTAYTTLLSLLCGIITVIVFYATRQRSETKVFYNQQSCCDSSIYLFKKLSQRIALLETQVKHLHLDTLKKNTKAIDNQVLEKRQSPFGKSDTSSLNNLLKSQEINFEFKQVESLIAQEKEINEIKISNLNDKIGNVIIWTSGLIIIIIGSIVGFAINAFKRD